METPATENTAPTPAPNPEPAKKPGRKPLDAAGRDAAASRSIARKLSKKLSVAKSADEFWEIADELAKKNGRAPIKADEEKGPQGPDPLDVPNAPSWPTPRQMAEVAPAVVMGLDMLGEKLKDTRYGVLTQTIKIPTKDGPPLEVPKSDLIQTPLIAVAALITGGKVPDMHPGWALLGASVFVFGPPAAEHAWEVFGPRVKAWWGAPKSEEKKKTAEAPAEAEKCSGPKLVKKGAAS